MAAALTQGDFVKRFPEFADIDELSFTCVIDEASRNVDQCIWGGKYCDGLAYYAAHLLASGYYAECTNGKPPAAGPVQWEQFGGVTVGYKVDGSNDGPLGGTKYGRQYLWLLKSTCRIMVL